MAPFQYDGYRNPYVGSITDLIRAPGEFRARAAELSGQANARAAEQSGQAWAGAVSDIGHSVAGAVQQATDPRRKLADLQVTEATQQAEDTKALKDLIRKTPKVNLGDGVMGYDVPTLMDAFSAAGRDPKLLMDHIGPVNAGLQQMHAGRMAAVKSGALALQAADNEPMLAGDFIDLLEVNHASSPKQLQQYRAMATTREGVAKLTAFFAGPQKMERGAPGSMAVNPVTGKPIEGSTIPDKPERPVVVGPGAIAVNPTTGATVATGPPKDATPKSLQSKSVLLDGKPTEVSYDPATGRYLLPSAGAPPSFGARFNNGQPGGAQKGDGYLGPLQRPDGSGVMSEYSIGVNINGKETEIPTLVPTLTKSEVTHILSMKDGDKMPDSIVQKARAFAEQRIAAGKDPFAAAGEQQALYPELKRAAPSAKATDGMTDVSSRVKPIPTQTSVTIQQGQSDAKSIADAIVSGDQPPDVKGLYRLAGPVRAELAKQGYDMTKANLDWEATKKHLSTLNGAQQTRLRQAISTASDSLGVIEDLAKQWDGGKFPILNKAALTAAVNGALGPKAQQIATNLTAQITDVTSELGNVYMGGNSPTDHALSLAGKNLSADWTRDQLLSAVKLARTNLQIRNNSILNSGAITSSSQNTPPPDGAPKTIRARDAKGVLHEAPAGTALPSGWKLEP